MVFSNLMCRICNYEGSCRIYVVKEMMYGTREDFDYFQCSQCECLQILDDSLNIAGYYDSSYYSFESKTKNSKLIDRLILERAKAAVSGIGIIGNILLKFFPAPDLCSLKPLCITGETTILDIGCGSGKMLNLLSKIGFKDLTGVDPYIQSEIRYPNGVRVFKDELKGIHGKWDVIMLHHSFEHVRNPNEVLRKIYELLTEKGVCIIRIPTVSSYAWKYYRENWVQIDAPRHQFLHSIKSMKLISAACGFVVDRINYDSNAFQILGSEQYIRNIDMRSPLSFQNISKKSIFSIFDVILAALKARRLNLTLQGDQAAFYLKKIV